MSESKTPALEGTEAKRVTRFGEYVELTKPRLTMLSVLTTLSGFYMASQGELNVALMLHTVLGTFMVGGACGALNMYVERHYDAQMRRTMTRPLPAGTLVPGEALIFGILLAVVGIAYLVFLVNMLTAVLAAVTVASYVLVYTPLKRISSLNTVVGGIPGAIPPMMGWAAARGELGLEAYALFAILFFWQMPHFLALAWMYRNDYERAGYRILPVVDKEGGSTRRQILLYTSALLPVSLIPTTIGLAGRFYFFGAFLLGALFLALGIIVVLRGRNKDAKNLFYYSLLYLPLLLLLMAFDRGM